MKKTIKLFFLIIFIWLALSNFSSVNAASAEIVAKPTSVKVGEKVMITVTVDAAAWNLKVSGSASGKIIGYNGEGINESTTKTYTIDTSKAGNYTVSLTGDVTDQSKNTPDIINKSLSITVKAEEKNDDDKTQNQGGTAGENAGNNASTNNGTTNNNTSTNNSTTNTNTNTGSNSGTTTPEKPKAKSTNAYLSTLGITPKEYDFSGFKKSNLNYSVTVPYEVDSLKVLYKTADSGATVKVTGNSGFEVGSNNRITIKVTAEDGKTTKTYTIKVTKLAEVEEKPGNIIDEEIEELCLTSLSLKGVDLSPEFSKDTYAYTAKLSNADMSEIEVEAKANQENASIEISGNTNLVVGENTINIVVKQEGNTKQAVYQITLTKEANIATTTGEEVNFMSNLIDNIKSYAIIAVIVVILIIATIVILIILLIKENKKIKNEETEEYNVYENDDNEFKNNKTEEIVEKETQKEEVTNETETKNEGRKTRRKEKGRHSK